MDGVDSERGLFECVPTASCDKRSDGQWRVCRVHDGFSVPLERLWCLLQCCISGVESFIHRHTLTVSVVTVHVHVPPTSWDAALSQRTQQRRRTRTQP
jgi:hypothetical protein